jgi:hypothetical protein
MNGGEGFDQFVFKFNRDVIFEAVTVEDFDQAGGERLDLSAIDARPAAGNQAFNFIGTSAFSGATGELRYEIDGGRTAIQMTIDTSGQVHRIFLDGVFSLSAQDFHL